MKFLVSLLLSFCFMYSTMSQDMVITHTIGEDVWQDVVDEVCDVRNYQTVVKDKEGKEILNPESREERAIREIEEHPYNLYVSHLAKQADSFRKTKIAEAELNRDKFSAVEMK